MTLGVLGAGSIGAHVARSAQAFGMRTVGYKPGMLTQGVPGTLILEPGSLILDPLDPLWIGKVP